MKKTPWQRAFSLLLAMMMLCSLVPVQVFAAGETIASAPVTVEMGRDPVSGRENDFNKGWKFSLGDQSSASNQNFDDSGWENVDLPHDFSITQNFTASGEAESGFLPGGTGWYRKSFVLDDTAEGKTFLLNFDGVYMHAYVYVNGAFVGEHHYGYTSFAFDITSWLVCDGITENVVAVKAVNNTPSSRWYSGSGIYRDVTLYAMEPVHVDLNGVTVTTPDIENGTGTASVETTLVNDGASAVQATVTSTIYAKGTSTALASDSVSVSVPAGSATDARTAPVVSSPRLWSVEDPNLYTLVTEVTVDGTVVDTCETEFGYRWFEFNSSGFHLNGKAVKLNGVCMHHDQGGLGAAAYYDAMYRQMSIMKDMGVNAIRTAHNPADEQYIAICNELGLLVIEETFDGLVEAKNENSNDFSSWFEKAAHSGLYGCESGMSNAEYAARSIVRRDRNAPSIIAWSFGNEIQEGTYKQNMGRFDEICADYIQWVNAEDGTRPVTSGDNDLGGTQALVDVINTITNAGGIAGFNYANSVSELYNLAQSYGGSKGVIIASETASATNSRGQYRNQNDNADSDGKYHLTSYDTSKVHWGLAAHDSIYNTYQYDNVAGEFVWTGFDYIGEPTPWNGTGSGDSGRGAIPNSSYFGIVETTGFAKDTYYLYRAQWNKDATTVHLVTAWDPDNMMTSGGKTPVWVYTNAPKVELYLNGQLIGTTTRSAVTSSAGHTYYTYTAQSNSNVCTVSNGSGADALYSVFNVAYTQGTLTARAYDANGKEITLDDSMGRHTVSTPDAPAKLNVAVDKTELAADGSSLAYIEIDVVDAKGNLDTTAANNITFTLSGPGEIAAVDNGDQATVRKYQNSYVLTSETTANIDAYAGKALVIVRSTEDAGEITLNIASDGLEGRTVTISTVSGDAGEAATGLTSYTMVRDYTVKAGTAPALDTAATGTLADGSTVSGTIAWNEVPAETCNTAGDYTITGTLTLPGFEGIPVSAKLHVIPNVVELRNVSAAAMEGTAPVLPGTVRGVLADGTLAGEFTVTWNDIPDASAYDTVGEIVTVTGTAVIFGDETMDVTCTVRVAEAVNTESVNVAPMADSLSQDVPAGSQSDNLNAILDGNTNPGENTNGRWTNWGNRYNSATAAITMTWATAQTLSGINLYYRLDNSCNHPEKIVFSYSLNGTEFIEVGAVESQMADVSVSYGSAYHYELEQVINPVALKVTFTQQNGTSGYCVGLYEIECMTYAASFAMNSSADLSGIAVDGTAIPGFAADTLAYEAEGGAVEAATAVNAGITVLPTYEGVVRVLTVSEDGTTSRTYEITMAEETCAHASREVRGKAAATCTEEGYTGDTWCTDCGELVESGAAIPATGHRNTVLQNVSAATCTENGYTGDTWCDDCQKIVSTGSVITSKGHAWDAGVITREPTEAEDGIKTFTCNTCGATKTEGVPYRSELKEPTVSLTLSKNKSTGKIGITGQVDDFENLEDYYEITAHGLLYIKTSRIGTRMLTLNTSGRTKVSFSGYTDEGAFTYNLKPTSKSTMYAFRAYVTYTDPETGKSVTVYSDMIRGSYNTISG